MELDDLRSLACRSERDGVGLQDDSRTVGYGLLNQTVTAVVGVVCRDTVCVLHAGTVAVFVVRVGGDRACKIGDRGQAIQKIVGIWSDCGFGAKQVVGNL